MVASRERTWTLLDKEKASQCQNVCPRHLFRIVCIEKGFYRVSYQKFDVQQINLGTIAIFERD